MAEGFRLLPGALPTSAQQDLISQILARIEAAPLYRPMTSIGRPTNVAMTNFGPLGWFSDRAGYRYVDRHPITGEPWPDIPAVLLDLWREHADAKTPPDACLVNRYVEGSRMSLHVDSDEADFAFPVLSVSLGDTAVFRLGGLSRKDRTASFKLASGDVCLLAGEARRAYHGVDRIVSGSSRLIPGGGRINLTMRRARPKS